MGVDVGKLAIDPLRATSQTLIVNVKGKIAGSYTPSARTED